MSCTTRRVRDVVILQPSGKFAQGSGEFAHEPSEFLLLVRTLLARGHTRLIIDLSDACVDTDSAGDLLAARFIAWRSAGEVKFLNTEPEHLELMKQAYRETSERMSDPSKRRRPVDMIGTTSILEVDYFSNETEAVVSFDCPTWQALEAWTQQGLSTREAGHVAAHLPDCPWCRQRLQIIAKA